MGVERDRFRCARTKSDAEKLVARARESLCALGTPRATDTLRAMGTLRDQSHVDPAIAPDLFRTRLKTEGGRRAPMSTS